MVSLLALHLLGIRSSHYAPVFRDIHVLQRKLLSNLYASMPLANNYSSKYPLESNGLFGGILSNLCLVT